MCLPSGEKIGAVSRPTPLVKRLAAPPERGTLQRSSAYENTMCVLLTVGCFRSKVCPDAERVATNNNETAYIVRMVNSSEDVRISTANPMREVEPRQGCDRLSGASSERADAPMRRLESQLRP